MRLSARAHAQAKRRPWELGSLPSLCLCTGSAWGTAWGTIALDALQCFGPLGAIARAKRAPAIARALASPGSIAPAAARSPGRLRPPTRAHEELCNKSYAMQGVVMCPQPLPQPYAFTCAIAPACACKAKS